MKSWMIGRIVYEESSVRGNLKVMYLTEHIVLDTEKNLAQPFSELDKVDMLIIQEHKTVAA